MVTRDDAASPAAAEQGRPAPPPHSYAARLERIARLRVPESEAERLWRQVVRHRRRLRRRIGRDVGQQVALLDYLLNIYPRPVDAAIVEKGALDAIERRAVSDPLTGLYDRGYFEHALKREVERCHRYRAVVSLLLLDLDDFKDVNDAYGHRVGDEVLQAFGSLIQQHLRGADVPCRVGGDEFAIILSDTMQAEACAVAERFRADVESWFRTRLVCGRLLPVTASGGIATAPFHASGQAELYAAADRALYQAKRAGANRIATAGSTAGPDAPPAG